MMVWDIEFTKEAQKDIRKLREPSRSHVNEAISKVAQNPLPLHGRRLRQTIGA